VAYGGSVTALTRKPPSPRWGFAAPAGHRIVAHASLNCTTVEGGVETAGRKLFACAVRAGFGATSHVQRGCSPRRWRSPRRHAAPVLSMPARRRRCSPSTKARSCSPATRSIALECHEPPSEPPVGRRACAAGIFSTTVISYACTYLTSSISGTDLDAKVLVPQSYTQLVYRPNVAFR
jgi:hypothetical protein